MTTFEWIVVILLAAILGVSILRLMVFSQYEDFIKEINKPPERSRGLAN